jgi:hypothetical protein
VKRSRRRSPQQIQEEKWQAEADLRTLREVEAIRADKGRLSRAEKLAKDELAALKKVANGSKRRTRKLPSTAAKRKRVVKKKGKSR